MKREDYYLVLRVASVVMAFLLWYLSVFFSNKGFNFQVQDMQWAAWILAASVTIIELVWTKQGFKPSPTLFVFGLAAYAYGIGTNILGIMEAQGNSASQNPISIVFPFVLGFFLEVIPEPLAIWGIIGVSDEGDFIGTLFGLKQHKPEFAIPSPQQSHPFGGGESPRIPCPICSEPIHPGGVRDHVKAKHPEVAKQVDKQAATGGKPNKNAKLPPFLAARGKLDKREEPHYHPLSK